MSSLNHYKNPCTYLSTLFPLLTQPFTNSCMYTSGFFFLATFLFVQVWAHSIRIFLHTFFCNLLSLTKDSVCSSLDQWDVIGSYFILYVFNPRGIYLGEYWEDEVFNFTFFVVVNMKLGLVTFELSILLHWSFSHFLNYMFNYFNYDSYTLPFDIHSTNIYWCQLYASLNKRSINSCPHGTYVLSTQGKGAQTSKLYTTRGW